MALGLFIAGALLAPSGLGAEAAPCGYPHRPFRCDAITKLDVDFLNDDVELPAAWSTNAGYVLRGQPAAFKIYVLTDDPGFYQEVTSCEKELRFRFHGIPRSRFRYEENDGDPRWVYTPLRRRIGGRTGTIEFQWKCNLPNETYTTNFVLTVLPSD
jgi:hypothetical protein